MREDCKFFQSRMYGSGDAARFCALDLAPEAPWRCPEECPRYQKAPTDAGLARASTRSEPQMGPGVADVLGAASGIINAAGPEIVAEAERRRRWEEAHRPWWQKLRDQSRWRR